MAELKAHRIDNIISAYKIGKAFCMKTEEEVYLKSEADKVIAEKNKVIAYARALVREDIKLIRHHKHKRCLAMAGWCDARADWYYSLGEPFRDCVQFYIKWRDKWRKLAEKFK